MIHDDRRENVKPSYSHSFSNFSIEPIEPRTMLAFGGAMDFGALHFHVHETAFAGFGLVVTPVHAIQLQYHPSGGVQLMREDSRDALQVAVMETLAEYAPVRNFVFAAPRFVVIIFNQQTSMEPPQMVQNPPPIEQPNSSNPVNVARAPAPTSVNTTTVTPPTVTSAQTVSVRASNEMAELLNAVQTTAAHTVGRSVATIANGSTNIVKQTWSIGSMLYPTLAPDENLMTVATHTESQPIGAVQIAPQGIGQMVIDAASSILQSPKKAMEIARMGSPLAFLGDSIANFIEESAAVPSAIIHTQNHQTAWIVTFTVLAADAILVANYYRRLRKLRALGANASYLPLTDDASPRGYQRPMF